MCARILIVANSPEVLTFLVETVSMQGYRADVVSSGSAARAAASGERPDLTLIEAGMPDGDGYALCRRFKSDGQTSEIPVIVILEHNVSAERENVFAAGGADYIAAPFLAAEVLARLETHLALCRLQNRCSNATVELRREIDARRQAEEALQRQRDRIDELVAERTATLSDTIENLRQDIAECRQLEAAMEQTNYTLHSYVYEYCLRNQRITLFNQMSERLQACLTLEETYPIIITFAQKLFPATAGALLLYDPPENTFTATAVWGTPSRGSTHFPAENCRVIRSRKSHTSIDSCSDSCCREIFRQSADSSLCIPLTAHGEMIGILHLQQQSPPKAMRTKPDFEEHQEDINLDVQRLASTTADLLAMALVNIKLRETLKYQATRDPLTGIFNRRYMEETLKREIHRAHRYETPVGIIMIDLDNFRLFNNTFGHDAGDVVLRDIGRFLEANIRQEDVACRYGGEEFTLILPGASLSITEKRAESIRHKALSLAIRYKDKDLDNVALSLGVAVFPEHGATAEELLQAADVALYRAKNAGRNQVVTASGGSDVQRDRTPFVNTAASPAEGPAPPLP
jgi:diguanylate cyclase (GGDEF)-like protein